jgi:hypothetical protein
MPNLQRASKVTASDSLMKKASVLIILLAALLFHACYVPRSFKKPVTVRLVEDFNVQLSSFVAQPQFLYYRTQDDYKSSFSSSFQNEVGYSKNVTLVNDDTSKVDYILKVSSFVISESESRETVNDANSPYNGNTFLLTSCDGTVKFEWYKASTGEKITDGFASLIKSEKVKNNQNIIQLATGTNKDNTLYRQKTLQDDVCEDIARRCGNRTWSAASAKLLRYTRK